MESLRAGAALPLTGRYGPFARDAAVGLRAWAQAAGVRLEIADCGESPAAAASVAVDLARRVDVLFGPYGSGATRAVADAFAGEDTVIWNHGGAAVERTGARIVDVLGPAGAYWEGLPDVLGAMGGSVQAVAVMHAATGFGAEVASGAGRSLRAAGYEPLVVAPFDAVGARAAVNRALDSGALAVIGCGRYEDDVALGRALAGRGVAVGLVASGVASAADALGGAVVGTFGPCQWLAADSPPPPGIGSGADYPAAQAYAAGLLAAQAVTAAGSADPDAVWDAARTLRTRTFLGPFRVDPEGRQLAHRPIIVRWEPGPGGPRRAVAWRPPT